MLLGVAVTAVVLGGTAVHAAEQAQPVLRIESSTAGEIRVEARAATIDDTLRALASATGIEIRIEPGIARPPVNMTLAPMSVEDALRQILRGRNYALVYEGDDDVPSQVIVLRPSVPARGTSLPQAVRYGRRR